MPLSESAAIVNPFFPTIVAQNHHRDTLQATGAEDKPLPGGNLSVDSGAKTRLGFSERWASAACELHELGWHPSDKSQGRWGRSPQKRFSFYDRFVCSAHFRFPFFRRTHVSAFNFCKSLFR